MNQFIRRIATATAAGSVAMAVVVPATSAASQATAQQCLNDLTANMVFIGPDVEPTKLLVFSPGKRVLVAGAVATNPRLCDGAVVSMGISRIRTGQDFRNVNATRAGSDFFAQWAMRWTDAGTWQIRQVAVSKGGRLAVRRFGAETPAIVTIKRASVLTGRDRNPHRDRFDVVGYLKAYSTTGKLVPMAAGRRIDMQIRRHGTAQQYWTFKVTYTSRSGFWNVRGALPAGVWDVRVGFVSPYRTIASDFAFIGTS